MVEITPFIRQQIQTTALRMNEIVRSEDTNICYIKEGVLIPRLSPKVSAKVIQSFSIKLTSTEEGYVATSHLCNIYELERTKGEAVRSYLYSLIDELIWLQKHEETLSKPLREELNRIKTYISLYSFSSKAALIGYS